MSVWPKKFFRIRRRLSIFSLAVLFLLSTYYFLSAHTFAQFVGPSTSAGTGAGAIGVDASGNLSIGTSTPQSNTKLLIVASSTDTSNFAIKIIQPNQGPVLVVRNDGSIGIGTSSPAYALDVVGSARFTGTFTAGTYSGPITSANVSAGSFGSNTGGGNYSFPASLSIATTTGPSGAALFVNGNVGIGTAAPTAKLTIGANPAAGLDTNELMQVGDTARTALYYSLATAGTRVVVGMQDGNAFQFGGFAGTFSNTRFHIRTNNVERMVFDTAGNVGIGTASPNALGFSYAGVLSIKGLRADDRGVLELIGNTVTSDGNDFGRIQFVHNSDGVANILAVRNGANDAAALTFSTEATGGSETERMRITSTGKVGIGTTDPGYDLDVAGKFHVSNPAANNALIVVPSYNNILSYVGINTGQPSAYLHITGPGNTAEFLRLDETNSTYAYGLSSNNKIFSIDDLTAGASRLTIKSTGEVTITGNLSVVGAISAGGAISGGAISGSSVSAPQGACCASDVRLKTNIQPLSGVLEKLQGLQAIRFDWNELYQAMGRSKGQGRQLGLIAQEVEPVFPELVTTGTESEHYKAIDYPRLTAVLVEAIKEQEGEIKALKARLEALERR